MPSFDMISKYSLLEALVQHSTVNLGWYIPVIDKTIKDEQNDHPYICALQNCNRNGESSCMSRSFLNVF
jgi:hypothetical protein